MIPGVVVIHRPRHPRRHSPRVHMSLAADMIKKFEGLRLVGYGDAKGVPTVGYGHTGAGVHIGMHITQAQADMLLEQDLESAEQDVARMAPHATPGQFAALTSFVFNLGAGALAGSRLLRKFRAGDIQGAADEFGVWNHCDGHVLQDLTDRRAAEKSVFLGNV